MSETKNSRAVIAQCIMVIFVICAGTFLLLNNHITGGFMIAGGMLGLFIIDWSYL